MSRSGYEFKGWNTLSTATTAMSNTSSTCFGWANSGNVSKTLYAVWEQTLPTLSLADTSGKVFTSFNLDCPIASVQCYKPDGTCTTYTDNYDKMVCYPGCMVVFYSKLLNGYDTSDGWSYKWMLGYFLGDGIGSFAFGPSIRFVVPSDATTDAILYVGKFGSNYEDYAEIYRGFEWMTKNKVTFEMGDKDSVLCKAYERTYDLDCTVKCYKPDGSYVYYRNNVGAYYGGGLICYPGCKVVLGIRDDDYAGSNSNNPCRFYKNNYYAGKYLNFTVPGNATGTGVFQFDKSTNRVQNRQCTCFTYNSASSTGWAKELTTNLGE